MPGAISDSSTLIHLAKIGRLNFLRKFHKKILVAITGVVGILIRAKREDMIPSLQEELDKLRDEAGFWIGDDVYIKALQSSEGDTN